MSNEFSFRRADGGALGTQGWEVEHERASCLSYTGLWRGKKVVALLVAKGAYDSLKEQIDDHGSFIVRACNSHDQLVAALGAITNMAERCDSWESFPSGPIEAARAALAAAGAA